MNLLNLILSIADSSVSVAVPFSLVGLLLLLLVLLYEPANRNAVRLLRAWKRPRGK